MTVMSGDNFRPVSPETSAWVLEQHRSLTAMAIDAAGPNVQTWASRIAPPTPPPPVFIASMASARQILAQVCAKHGIVPTDLRAHWRRPVVVAARHEFWARCRAEIVINGAPASWAWIARLTGHDHSSVHRGAKLHNQSARTA